MKTKILFLFLIPFLIFGQSKGKYDIKEAKFQSIDAAAKYGARRENIKATLGNMEATLLEGGYYTIGTSEGFSASSLDNNCQLTFGHPLALTSFVKLYTGSEWHTPFGDLENNIQQLTSGEYSISLSMDKTNDYKLELSISRISDNSLTVAAEVTNNSGSQNNFALGFVYDAAIGNNGDAAVYNGTELLDTPVKYSTSLPAVLKLNERSGQKYGIGTELETETNNTESVTIDNWNSFAEDQEMILQADVLFDAAIELTSKEVSLQAGEKFSYSFTVNLTGNNFGDLFMRADMPERLTITDGVPFPLESTARVQLFNTTFSYTNVRLNLSFSDYFESQESESSSNIPPSKYSYNTIDYSLFELYSDQVVTATIEAVKNNTVLDRLEKKICIPSVELSDEGLALESDTLLMSDFPKISAKFRVQEEESKKYLYNLKDYNILLYENDTKIEDFTFAKDTSEGASNVDVIFVLDVTGSMGNEIEAVKNNIVEFSDSLEERNIDYQLGLVTFRDEVTDIYDFTKDVEKYKGYIGQQFASGGGDYPENSLDALNSIDQFNFRNESNRIVVWITDASYHINNSYTTQTQEDVVGKLLTYGLTVHCIGNTVERVGYYEPITLPTGGKFYDINGNFRDILLDITRIKYTGKYLLSYTSGLPLGDINSIVMEVHYGGLGLVKTLYSADSKPETAEKKVAVSCYPNPFNPSTNIKVVKPANTEGRVRIFNVLGQEVRSFNLAKGQTDFTFLWNGASDTGIRMSSGVYIVTTELYGNTGNITGAVSQKVIYIK